jgi:hypothetical protein
MFPETISNSKLEDALCLIKFRQKYIDRIRPVGKSVHLTTGAAFAAGLAGTRTAFFMNGKAEEAAINEGLRDLLKAWDIEEDITRGKKNLFSTIDALHVYFQRFPLGSDPIPLILGQTTVEFDFALPLPVTHPDTGQPILYSGRCDMIGGNKGAPQHLFIVDEKTTSYLGDSWAQKMLLKGQLMVYVWAGREHGFPILAAFVRGIAFRTNDGFDMPEVPLWYKDFHIERWYNSTVSKVKHLVRAYQENDWPYDFSTACTQFNSICPYYSRCLAKNPEEIDGFAVSDKVRPMENW